jgi:protein gp37
MAENTTIEWTDHTWNPWWGCTKVSDGCKHCYAERESKRHTSEDIWGRGRQRLLAEETVWQDPETWNEQAGKQGTRARVFCLSMGDINDDGVDPAWRKRAYDVIRANTNLDWLLLTKRPENFKKMLPKDWGDGWPHVCLMTSIENQSCLSRLTHLLETRAKFRALSCEPLLGPIHFKPSELKKIDWCIVGGESGTSARPIHPQWVRDIRSQCETAQVDFFFKQWGNWREKTDLFEKWTNTAFFPSPDVKPEFLKKMKKAARDLILSDLSDGVLVEKLRKKKAAGKLLDGQVLQAHPFGKSVTDLEWIFPLTASEKKDLADCEDAIGNGLHTFFVVGNALAHIRDNRLYRLKFPTFEQYCDAIFRMSRPYAYNLMDSSKTFETLSAIADKDLLPLNESQVRPLNRLKDGKAQMACWTKAVERSEGQIPTAAVVQEIVDELNGTEPTKPTRHEIRKKEIRQCLSSALSKIPKESLATFRTRLVELLAEFLPQETEEEEQE